MNEEFTVPENEPMRLSTLRRLRERHAPTSYDVCARFHPCHDKDVWDLPGFVPQYKYARFRARYPNEAGVVEMFRLVPLGDREATLPDLGRQAG